MKRILVTLLGVCLILSLGGCKSDASMAVEDYLAKYNALDVDVLTDMNTIIASENLTDENKSVYEGIFKKQYTDMTYSIVSEEYDGDEAIVKAKVKVYDLYKVQKNTTTYLANNADEFNDENGVYDVQKYMQYKLEQMKNATETVEYTIDFYVVKTSDGWRVTAPSNADLEKIHGIYDYES